MRKTESLAWAILNGRTGKLVGTYFPQLFGSRMGAAGQAVGRNERPVQVRVIPVLKPHGVERT
jgi:hypothetical protein